MFRYCSVQSAGIASQGLLLSVLPRASARGDAASNAFQASKLRSGAAPFGLAAHQSTAPGVRRALLVTLCHPWTLPKPELGCLNPGRLARETALRLRARSVGCRHRTGRGPSRTMRRAAPCPVLLLSDTARRSGPRRTCRQNAVQNDDMVAASRGCATTSTSHRRKKSEYDTLTGRGAPDVHG